jgi:hypothetical protein
MRVQDLRGSMRDLYHRDIGEPAPEPASRRRRAARQPPRESDAAKPKRPGGGCCNSNQARQGTTGGRQGRPLSAEQLAGAIVEQL